MTRQALIRVDADPEIGLGHLSRCLSLAHALAAFNVDTSFVVREPASLVRRKLDASGHKLIVLPKSIEPGSADDADAVMRLLEDEPARQIVIVDHYAVDERWETPVRACVDQFAVIDDLADRSHNCDVLIDQNRMFDGEFAYRKVLNDDAIRLIGPRYALLRPEFAERRQRRIERNRPLTPRSVVVSFGGADAAGHTLAVVEALKRCPLDLDRMDILLTSSSRHRAAVERFIQADERFRVHVDCPEVAKVFEEADLAIGGGGVTSWERICLSIPSIVFGIVPNQSQNVRELLRAGLAIGVPEMYRPDGQVIETWLRLAMSSPEMLLGIAERCGTVVDGLGARRVASRLLRSRIQLREAVRSDRATLFEWRNHPAIRAVSLDSRELSLDEHEQWFEQSLGNPTRLILLAEEDTIAVGVVRFDFSGRAATISVFKNPSHWGQLDIIGKATDWLFNNRKDIAEVAAVVLADNARSISAFQIAGYQLRQQHFVALRDRWQAQRT